MTTKSGMRLAVFMTGLLPLMGCGPGTGKIECDLALQPPSDTSSDPSVSLSGVIPDKPPEWHGQSFGALRYAMPTKQPGGSVDGEGPDGWTCRTSNGEVIGETSTGEPLGTWVMVAAREGEGQQSGLGEGEDGTSIEVPGAKGATVNASLEPYVGEEQELPDVQAIDVRVHIWTDAMEYRIRAQFPVEEGGEALVPGFLGSLAVE